MTIGTYRVQSTLSVGESSTIYRAEGSVGPIALKVLHPHYASDPVVAERFIAYTQVVAGVADPGVARIHDVFRDGETVASAMEYLGGGSLAERDDVDPRSLLELLLRTLGALHARGIVHRDIRPSHIVFDGQDRPRLIDFAGASVRDLAGLSRSTVHTVRREYVDPTAWGTGIALPGQDLYSLGAVVGELMEGKDDASGDSYLRSVVSAMTGDRHTRPSSAEEVLSWLAAGGRTIGARMAECLYCGAIMPAEAIVCLECGKSPPTIRKDPDGEYLALRKVSEEQSVLGPFLSTLKLLSAEPIPEFQLILGDARLYSREERKRGYELPVRIADEIASESVTELIRLLTAKAPDRIHVERYPMSRLRKVKRGPLITLAYRTAAPPAGVDALRRAAGRFRTAVPTARAGAGDGSATLRSRFLHAVGIAARRLTDLPVERIDVLVAEFDSLFERYRALLDFVGQADLQAAYADIERELIEADEAVREGVRRAARQDVGEGDPRRVFSEYADATRLIAAIEATVARVSLALESVSSQDAETVIANVARDVSAIAGDSTAILRSGALRSRE